MRRLSGRCEEVGREEGYHTDCEWAARTGDAVWVHGAEMGWERQEKARAEPVCTVSFHGGYSVLAALAVEEATGSATRHGSPC